MCQVLVLILVPGEVLYKVLISAILHISRDSMPRMSLSISDLGAINPDMSSHSPNPVPVSGRRRSRICSMELNLVFSNRLIMEFPRNLIMAIS